MCQLLDSMYGKDHLEYKFTQGKGTIVQESDDPRCVFQYDHDLWETNYKTTVRFISLGTGELAKSLRPLLDTCIEQNDEEAATSTMPAIITPVQATQCSSSSSTLVTAAISPCNVPSVIHANTTVSTDSVMPDDNTSLLAAINQNSMQGKKQGKECPTGVIIPKLGTFSRSGITILKKFCKIASLKAVVRSEERWLNENPDRLSVAEICAIKEILWNHGENTTVLRAGGKSFDVASFSTLVGERYLDNFVIDVCILSFLQDFQGKSKALYLPSEAHTWLSTKDSQFIHRKLLGVLSTSKVKELDLLLCPLHMNQSHWGLIVIDLLHRKLMFDDGYKLKPSTSVLPTIKHILDVFHQLRPDAHCFGNSFWASADHFERFGMPSQADCGEMGQGSGSCGVGVILAARDFLSKVAFVAMPQFEWQYSQMRCLRKQLMLQVIKWRSSV